MIFGPGIEFLHPGLMTGFLKFKTLAFHFFIRGHRLYMDAVEGFHRPRMKLLVPFIVLLTLGARPSIQEERPFKALSSMQVCQRLLLTAGAAFIAFPHDCFGSLFSM